MAKEQTKPEEKQEQTKPEEKASLKYQVLEECYFGGLKKPGDIVHSSEDLPETIYKKV